MSPSLSLDKSCTKYRSLQKRWTDAEIGAVVARCERDLERRVGAGDETARKQKRKLFRQKVLYTALNISDCNKMSGS